jgi:hypothetical protein
LINVIELSRIAARSSLARGGPVVGLLLAADALTPLDGEKSRGRFAPDGVNVAGAE